MYLHMATHTTNSNRAALAETASSNINVKVTSHFNFSKSKTARSPLRKARQEHIVAWNPGSESCVDLSSKRCGVGSMQTATAHTSLTIKSAPEIAGETPSTPQDQRKKISLLNSTASGLILHWIYSISSLNILIYDYNCKLELRVWISAPSTHTVRQMFPVRLGRPSSCMPHLLSALSNGRAIREIALSLTPPTITEKTSVQWQIYLRY